MSLYFMRLNKRGQFFILAAVTIAAIVLSFGLTANRARVNQEPENFYDFTYEVKREAGAVIDYEIYTNIQGGGNLEDFVQLLAEDIRDKDPDANFIFIYGDNSDVTVRNYGSESVDADGQSIAGAGAPVINRIILGGSGQAVNATYSDFNENWVGSVEGVDELEIEIKGNKFKFPFSKHRQIVFVLQKEDADESFVAVK